MIKNKTLLLLIIIAAVASFFRLWRIDSAPPGLYPDEAMNGNNALEALETGEFKIFYPENNGREGLFINIQAISLKVFENKPWALRLISSIFGILTVLGLFLLTKELFKSRRIALFAGFFLATSFWHINFSRIGFRAIMAPFFLVWGIYFLLLNFRKIKFYGQNLKILIFSAVGGLLYGLGFYSYIAYRATPALIIALMLGYWFTNHKTINNKKFLLLVAGYWLLVIIIISPLAFHFYNNPQDFLGRTSQISIFSAERPLYELGKNILKTTGMFWYRGDYNWRHNYAGAPQLWWPVGILFALGVIISFHKITQNSPKESLRLPMGQAKLKNPARLRIDEVQAGGQNHNSKLKTFNFLAVVLRFALCVLRSLFTTIYGFLILWLIIGLLPVIISSEGIPHALRAIIILPAVMILCALGLDCIISKIQNWLKKQKEKYPEYSWQLDRMKKGFIVLLLAFFTATAIQSYTKYFIRWTNSPYVRNAFSQDLVEIGEYLNSLPQNLPKYVIINTEKADATVIPMPAQTVMFITKTYLPKWQEEKNTRYVLPKDISLLSKNQWLSENLIIIMLKNDPIFRQELKEKIPNLQSDGSPGFMILKK